MASPETVPRDLDETTVTIIQDTPERRLAVLGEIDEAYGRDVRAGARNRLLLEPNPCRRRAGATTQRKRRAPARAAAARASRRYFPTRRSRPTTRSRSSAMAQ